MVNRKHITDNALKREKSKRLLASEAKGFTIIELLIATIVFSTVLTIIVASFLQIGHMFYKGVSINNTTKSTANLVDAITTDARLTSKPAQLGNLTDTTPGITKRFFCVGPHRYTFVLNSKVQGSDVTANSSSMSAGVIQDDDSSCANPTTSGGNSTQMLGPDMQLNKLDFIVTGSAAMVRAHVIFYGDDSTVFNSTLHPNDTATDHAAAVNNPDAYCSGDLLSTQFCAASDIVSNVTLRY
jgi:prepilin-type N-terminal cleavage/methylation domain-containing protein